MVDFSSIFFFNFYVSSHYWLIMFLLNVNFSRYLINKLRIKFPFDGNTSRIDKFFLSLFTNTIIDPFIRGVRDIEKKSSDFRQLLLKILCSFGFSDLPGRNFAFYGRLLWTSSIILYSYYSLVQWLESVSISIC